MYKWNISIIYKDNCYIFVHSCLFPGNKCSQRLHEKSWESLTISTSTSYKFHSDLSPHNVLSGLEHILRCFLCTELVQVAILIVDRYVITTCSWSIKIEGVEVDSYSSWFRQFNLPYHFFVLWIATVSKHILTADSHQLSANRSGKRELFNTIFSFISDDCNWAVCCAWHYLMTEKKSLLSANWKEKYVVIISVAHDTLQGIAAQSVASAKRLRRDHVPS